MTRGFWEHLDQCLDLLRYLGGHGHRAFNWSCTASSESCRRYLTSLDLCLCQFYVDSRKTVQFSSLNSMMNIRTLTLSPLFAEFKGQKMSKKWKTPAQKKSQDLHKLARWATPSVKLCGVPRPYVLPSSASRAPKRPFPRPSIAWRLQSGQRIVSKIIHIYYPSHSNLIISSPPLRLCIKSKLYIV